MYREVVSENCAGKALDVQLDADNATPVDLEPVPRRVEVRPFRVSIFAAGHARDDTVTHRATDRLWVGDDAL